MTFTSALDKTLEFVRPTGGRRVVAKPHVPLLALMAPYDAAADGASATRP